MAFGLEVDPEHFPLHFFAGLHFFLDLAENLVLRLSDLAGKYLLALPDVGRQVEVSANDLELVENGEELLLVRMFPHVVVDFAIVTQSGRVPDHGLPAHETVFNDFHLPDILLGSELDQKLGDLDHIVHEQILVEALDQPRLSAFNIIQCIFPVSVRLILLQLVLHDLFQLPFVGLVDLFQCLVLPESRRSQLRQFLMFVRVVACFPETKLPA